MIIAIVDQNECNFAIQFDDESKAEKVEELMVAGLSSWYEAAHEDIEDNDYFKAEEIEMMYNDGYAEPTLTLLEREGIKGEIIDVEYDDYGDVINADKVIVY